MGNRLLEHGTATLISRHAAWVHLTGCCELKCAKNCLNNSTNLDAKKIVQLQGLVICIVPHRLLASCE